MAETIKLVDGAEVRERVREKYGQAARTVLNGQGGACCGGSAGSGESCCGEDTITGSLYDASEAAGIPEASTL